MQYNQNTDTHQVNGQDFAATPAEKAITAETLAAYQVDPESIPNQPPDALRMGGQTVATLGNISLIIGKAKSKKSFLTALMASAAIRSSTMPTGDAHGYTGHLPDQQRGTLVIDTEQGSYHAAKHANRIHRLAESRPGLHYYALRELATVDRMEAIEHLLQAHSDTGLLIIDGIRDLAAHGINDEENATQITDLLLRLSQQFNVHIINVLHQNKGDFNARGHLGSELVNKAETVLSVAKSEDDENISIVFPEFTRNKEPGELAFKVNEDGLPEVKTDWERPVKSHPMRKMEPHEVPDHQHKSVINELRANISGHVSAAEMRDQLTAAISKHIEPISDKPARKYFTHYVNEGSIITNGANTHKRKYSIPP